MSSLCKVETREQSQHSQTQHGLVNSIDDGSLSTAIESASHAQLCLVLRQLCAYSKTATDIAAKHLIPTTLPEEKNEEKEGLPSKPIFPRSILKKTSSFGPTSQTTQKSSPVQFASSQAKYSPPSPQKQNENDPTSSNPNNDHKKRKAQTQCRNCGSWYPAPSTFAIAEACVHHPGKREVNPSHSVWENFDPDVLGDAWTLMEYEEFACGFRWSCCEREVGAEGCVVGRHEAAPAPVEVRGWGRKRKRQREGER